MHIWRQQDKFAQIWYSSLKGAMRHICFDMKLLKFRDNYKFFGIPDTISGQINFNQS